jgi:elongation factor Tu
MIAFYAAGEALTLADLLSRFPQRLVAGSVVAIIGVCVGLVLGFLWPVFSAFLEKLPELNTQLNQRLAPIIEKKINASPLSGIEIDIQSFEERFSDTLRGLIEELFADERIKALANELVKRGMEGLKQHLADAIMPSFTHWLREQNERCVNANILEQYLRETVSSAIVDKLAATIGSWRKRLALSWISLVLVPLPILWIPAGDEVTQEPVAAKVPEEPVPVASGECIRLTPENIIKPPGHLPHVNLITTGHPQALRARLSSAITYHLYREGLADYVSPPCFVKSHTERRRGLEMGLWYVKYTTFKRHYAHTHFTAQPDFIKAMFTGEVSAEGAVLTVSAREGIAEEVREQLQLMRRIGPHSLVAFIDTDGTSDVSTLKMQLQSYLSELGFGKVPLIIGATKKFLEGGNDTMQKLLAAIDSTIPSRPKLNDKPFLMPVESVFTTQDRGIVVLGRIEEGIVRVGDRVEIVGMGSDRSATVTGLEWMRKLLDQAGFGDNIGVVFSDVSRDAIERGQVLAASGTIDAETHFEAAMYLLTSDDGGRTNAIASGYRPQLYFRTTDVTGTITLPPEQAQLSPGEHTLVDVRLAVPIALRKGLRFAVREGGQTVGVGVVTTLFE